MLEEVAIGEEAACDRPRRMRVLVFVEVERAVKLSEDPSVVEV